ncbi:Ulvan lyase, long isoform [Neolewinella maritima]|uniref:Ulvan lyase, long isoform n=2 Tax=Neolewinella maritima TaxID=1383882 RepID=A0ABN8EZN3_9BACT|nr:Ulvan lyase, long isoform [Neolewinella maritima]
MIDESLVATDGLYFAGERGTDYQFGSRISAHGDCMAIVNGFVFVSWYRGGMDRRNLMLSRRRVDTPEAEWVTIEFPDRHIGYRGDTTKGDSHNTAAVAVSMIDSTVHLLYDMHAYDAENFPDHYFNYRVTAPGAAFVADADFTRERFNDRRDYLVEGKNYERTTYPGFVTDAQGRLIVGYRLGGSGSGEHLLAVYDSTGWNESFSWAQGRIPLPHRYSVYGSMKMEQGKLHSGFSIRYAEREKYVYNSGLYYAYALPPYGLTDWYDVDDQPIRLPIGRADAVQLATPAADYGTAEPSRTSSGPEFTVSGRGDIHFITTVDGRNVHYWRPAGSQRFSSAVGGVIPSGKLYSSGDILIGVELSDGRIRIRTAPVGTNDWQTVYTKTDGPQFSHFRSELVDGLLYAYLQEQTGGDARPLYLQIFDLKLTRQ